MMWRNLREVAYEAHQMVPRSTIDTLVSSLVGSSDIFEDMLWLEASDRLGHQFRYRDCDGPAARCQITLGRSRALAEESEEIRLICNGLALKFHKNLFYGSPPEDARDFWGFAPLYNTVNPEKAQNAANVIDALGASGDLHSIWLIRWREHAITMRYPLGSQGGLIAENIDCDVGGYHVTAILGVDVGLAVEDWRYAVRIANVDISTFGCGDMVALMEKAMLRLPQLRSACCGHDQRSAFYVGRDVSNALRGATSLRDVPIRVIEALRKEPRVI